MKKIFLTGGSGFIGRHVLEKLGGRYDIVAPSHSGLNLLDAEAVERFVKENDFDVIINAANIGGNRKNPGPADMVELNLRMFYNIARCSGHFGKMIHLGSGAEYGKQADIKMAREGDFGKRVPSDAYGFYKYVCSKHIENSEDTVCLRIFGCYGKYEDYEYKFISNAICRVLSGMPIRINNRNVVFSYLYVDDFIGIIDHFILNKNGHRFYNATPDKTVDLLTISEIIRGLSGKKPKIEVRNPGLGLEYSGNNDRLKGEIPGIKFTDIKSGVKTLYEWYEENAEIDKNKLKFSG